MPGPALRFSVSGSYLHIVIYYLFKRIAWIVPTLVVVTMITFFLSYTQQGAFVTSDCLFLGSSTTPPDYYTDCVHAERTKRGLNKAPFILSIHPLSQPDSLYLFTDPLEYSAVRTLCFRYGNWPLIQTFRQHIFHLIVIQDEVMGADTTDRPDIKFLLQDVRELSANLLRESDASHIRNSLRGLEEKVSVLGFSDLRQEWVQLMRSWEQVELRSQRWKTWVPIVSWHGWDCQYIDWLSAVIFRFEFGQNDSNRDVIRTINALLPQTLLFTGTGILLAFILSIPLAVWSARHAGRNLERLTGLGLLMLDSVPSFWMALMLLMIFADPEFLGWFPSSYLPYAPTGKRIASMILPLLTFTYGSLAFLTRSLRASILEVYQQPFIRIARTQGYSERFILFRHVLRPALLPTITVLGTIFPVLVSGSVILEGIFNINGLGYTILKSTLNNDQNVILAIFSLSAIMTLAGYLVSDFLYALADPRIRFTSQSKR